MTRIGHGSLVKKESDLPDIDDHPRPILIANQEGIDQIKSGKWTSELVRGADNALSEGLCSYCQSNEVRLAKMDLENGQYCALCCICLNCRTISLLDTCLAGTEEEMNEIVKVSSKAN